MTYIVAGDIGGTNARLVMYEATGNLLNMKEFPKHKVIAQMYYKNNDFRSFTEVLCAFTASPSVVGKKIISCCLATAGPVSNNRINFTNREGWIVDGRAIKEEFGIEHVQLVNDFVANGYGLLGLDESEVVKLQGDNVAVSALDGLDMPTADDDSFDSAIGNSYMAPLGPKALVGAGTGLGECFLTPDSDGFYQAFASEGGHVEFAPRTDLEEDLLHYLQQKLDLPNPDPIQGEKPRVSIERIVSGRGLENIYEFLRTKFPDQVNPHFDTEYSDSSERGRLIGTEKYNYNLFSQALEIMFAIYGGEVGNVALKFLPHGGLYIAGGIAPKNIEFISNPNSDFMRRFRDKGRMRSIMATFPVFVVMKEDLGIRGAHIVAARNAGKAMAHLERMRLEAVTSPLLDRPLNGKVGTSPRLNRLTSSAFAEKSDTFRNAVTDYPMTYAVAMSVTAGITAAALSLGGRLIATRSGTS